MTTIVLADDHPVVRQGLRRMLEANPELRVIGEAGDGLEAIQLVERLQPDLLILDLMLPGINGLEVARQVKRRAPNTRIVILSMYDAEPYVVEALRAGVSAYVLKMSQSDELTFAIRQALAGQTYLSPTLNARAIKTYLEKAEQIERDPYESLTERERQVLQLAAEGLNNPGIAERLSISVRTVEMHRGNLMRKLALRNQSELIQYALRRGILPPQS